MQDEARVLEAEWYAMPLFDLAVAVEAHAFILGRKGWERSSAAIVRQCERLPDFAAVKDRYLLEWHGIDPTVVAAYVSRGITPPRPRRIRCAVLVEQVEVIGGKDSISGNVYLQFDDGHMKPIDGRELSRLAERVPRLKHWRIWGRPDYD
jgi:hypothetical protein